MPAVLARRNETHSPDTPADGCSRVLQPWLCADVLLELLGLSGKLSCRRDRAVADIVDVAMPIFGKFPVGKLEQALVPAGLGFRIVAELDPGKCLHHPRVDIEQRCCLLDLSAYVVVRRAVGVDVVWQRHRRPIHGRVGIHDVALRGGLVGLIRAIEHTGRGPPVASSPLARPRFPARATDARPEPRPQQEPRPRSRHGHIRRLGYSSSLGHNRSSGHNGKFPTTTGFLATTVSPPCHSPVPISKTRPATPIRVIGT